MTAKDDLVSIEPKRFQRVIDVLEQAKIDVTGWSNYKGKHAAAHPESFQWSFEQPGERVALFLWWTQVKIDGKGLTYKLAPRVPTGLNPWSEAKWRASSDRLLRHVQTAYEQQLPVAAVIVDGKVFNAKTNPKASKVERRRLDEVAWAVADFDYATRTALLVRGIAPVNPDTRSVDAELSAFEGKRRKAFIWHRHREASLRRAKIAEAISANGGRLICEVPRCGFDFRKTYGKIGTGYAHVHHTVPLGKTLTPRKTKISELAIVCPNCHAMIHIGGECRDLANLIPQ